MLQSHLKDGALRVSFGFHVFRGLMGFMGLRVVVLRCRVNETTN